MDNAETQRKALAKRIVTVAVELWRLDESLQRLLKEFAALLEEIAVAEERFQSAVTQARGN